MFNVTSSRLKEKILFVVNNKTLDIHKFLDFLEYENDLLSIAELSNYKKSLIL